MIFVFRAEARECRRVVTHDDSAKRTDHGDLPRVVFAHSVRGPTLQSGNPSRVGSVNALPRVPAQIGFNGRWVVCSLEHFCQGHGTHPHTSATVSGKPAEGWPFSPVCQLVEQVDDEGRIEQAFFHFFETRNRTSPERFFASTKTSPAVSNGSSRISCRTKVARFMPAERDRRFSIVSSSSLSLTVKIDIVR
jgi:hypothetical protein